MAENDNFAILRWRKLDLETAYGYDRQAIYNFIKGVAEHPENYADKGDKKDLNNLQYRHRALMMIRDAILSLSLDPDPGKEDPLRGGPEYQEPGIPQHIRRINNPERKKKLPKGTPRDPVSPYLIDPHFLPRFPAMLPKNMKYWNPGDLLGLFFALLGPAPAGANAVRFFLPLTAVYGRWCLQIMDVREGKKKYPKKPFMLNCTWAEPGGDHQRLEFFLGVSLGGYSGSDGPLWQKEVNVCRYELVRWFTTDAGWNNVDMTGAMLEARYLRSWFVAFQFLVDQLDLSDTTQNLEGEMVVQWIQEEIRKVNRRLENFPFSVKGGEAGRTDQAATTIQITNLLNIWNGEGGRPLLDRLLQCKNDLRLLIQTAERIANAPITRFGNCAETYPFMNVLRDKLRGPPLAVQGRSWGLALQTSALSENAYNDEPPNEADPESGKIYRNLRPPCVNCKFLLSQLGHTVESIEDNFGEQSIRDDLNIKYSRRRPPTTYPCVQEQ